MKQIDHPLGFILWQQDTMPTEKMDFYYYQGVLKCPIVSEGKAIPVSAISCWRMAAALGHPIAQYNMYIACMNGYGCDKNVPLALQYLDQAAAQHFPPALDAKTLFDSKN